VYDRTVARSEQLYDGDLLIDGETVKSGEVWYSDGTAVAYARKQVLGVMKGATVTIEDGRMVATGSVNGEPQVWAAVMPEKTITSYREAKVTLPGRGEVIVQVEVTNHKVRLTGRDLPAPIDLPGAKVRTMGGRNAVITVPHTDQPRRLADDDQPALSNVELAMLLPKSGCGCGGSKW
jgi:hypothetical protein